MPKVVSMLNMKGGVGKTTLTYNLAWYLADFKFLRILAIDLDPQSNLTQLMLGEDGYEQFLDHQSKSVVDIFEHYSNQTTGATCLQKIHQWAHGGYIHLLPSRLELSTTLKNPTSKERRLTRFLSGIKDNYDIVLMDCPPTESILTTAAYLASDYVLVPVKLERLATIGLPLMARSIKDFNEEYHGEKQVEVAGILLNDVDISNAVETGLAREDILQFAKQFQWNVFKHEVRTSRAYVNSCRQGTPVFRTARMRGLVAEEFFEVGNEFLRAVGWP